LPQRNIGSTMKFQPDHLDVPSIGAYGPGWVAIAGERIGASLVLSSRGIRQPWACSSFQDLGASHFDQLAELQPELVIFGSGQRLHFPRPQWLQSLVARRIGIETMDTAAACRTYNILASEGRHVVAALLLEGGGAPD
jgi:uncharacterized protein